MQLRRFGQKAGGVQPRNRRFGGESIGFLGGVLGHCKIRVIGHCKMQRVCFEHLLDIGAFCWTPLFEVFNMKILSSFIGAVALASLSLSAWAAQPDVRRGAQLYGQMCVACHAADGNSATAANPKLAQQHPEYLIKQLKEYKSGKRANAIMSGFAAALSEQDMADISYWLAAQSGTSGFARNKDLVNIGERIYRGGIPDRQIAACAGCHSPNGAGIPAQYPRLSGQHAEYTADQLRQFRSGARNNNGPMTQIAAHMTDQEIEAVSDFIAGLR
jgi:cytochrome c553